jgi:hypothetical protein
MRNKILTIEDFPYRIPRVCGRVYEIYLKTIPFLPYVNHASI